MFFVTYLRRELRRRMRQGVLVALGLALGVGLVVTVSAASAGVKKAEAGVLSGLYGVGTEVTVSGPAETVPPVGPGTKLNGQIVQPGPHGLQICTDGHCADAAGHTIDELYPPLLAPVSASAVAAVARLHDVAAASGVLTLADHSMTFPAGSGDSLQSGTFSVDGVATGRTSIGPLSAATITSGHLFTAGDADADAAVVDSLYAASDNLKAGSFITIRQVRFTVIGIVSQPQGNSPPDVYIPLARAQAIATLYKGFGGSLANEVTLIYVTAASAADISAVQHEIARLLPHATVTTASSLASEVTGSVANAAKLANDLGKWLAFLVLIAAFAVASLLTMSAVARRVGEFGTLKAIGWRTRRIVIQVLGESVAMGIAGAAVGVGLGFAGAAIIAKVAPKLSATVPGSTGGTPPFLNRTVLVPLSPSVTVGVIVLAVILAVAGGLLAGSFGSWRIAKLRPADALSRVA
jgi:putative ABC transport system permease protein